MFILNTYRKGMPLPKQILEDLIFRFRWLYLYFVNGGRTKTVLFFPQYPSKRSVLYKMLVILRYNRTNNPRLKHQLIINWEDTTSRTQYEWLEMKAESEKVLNIGCKDISKNRVDELFTDVFGYSTRIDPTVFQGECVRKSDLNAQHDGTILQCPLTTKEPGYIYQIVINNRFNDEVVEDLRVPIIGKKIPLVFLKYKPYKTRFGSFLKFKSNIRPIRVVRPLEVFSEKELELIGKFTSRMKLDYGELDILRNRDDGKIYIIDCNNTPTGPSHLTKKEKKEALGILAHAFENEFMAINKDQAGQ